MAKAEKKIICIDTETTGLKPFDDEVLELAIIAGGSEPMEYKVIVNKRYRPIRKKSWPEAEAVHKISPYYVECCQKIEKDSEAIAEIINNSDIILGYNIEFDIKMLIGCGIKINDDWEEKAIDVMQEFAIFNDDWSYYFEDYKWKTLSFAYKRLFGEKYDCIHSALNDAIATYKVYRALISKGFLKEQ